MHAYAESTRNNRLGILLGDGVGHVQRF
jgi:hypothetical protein